MRRQLLLSALALILLSASCLAVSVNAPGTIIVQGEQKSVLVSIRNDSSFEQDYSVDFVSPLDAFVSPSSGKIAAGKSATVALYVSPQEGLEGSTYEGTLEVELGSEKAFRKISVLFKDAGSNQPAEQGDFGFAGFASLLGSALSLENAVNLVLVLVAAVLLIAFIARLVKRMEA